MMRMTKRRLVLGLAGLLMVVGIGTSVPVSANPSCGSISVNGVFTGNDDPLCGAALRTQNFSGFINPNLAADFGGQQTNIEPTLGQQRAYDALASTDRVNGH
jgi:hypothetical protein